MTVNNVKKILVTLDGAPFGSRASLNLKFGQVGFSTQFRGQELPSRDRYNTPYAQNLSIPFLNALLIHNWKVCMKHDRIGDFPD